MNSRHYVLYKHSFLAGRSLLLIFTLVLSAKVPHKHSVIPEGSFCCAGMCTELLRLTQHQIPLLCSDPYLQSLHSSGFNTLVWMLHNILYSVMLFPYDPMLHEAIRG